MNSVYAAPLAKPGSEPIGLLAGWGLLPVLVARQLKAAGRQVFCCGIRGHASEELSSICEGFRWVGLARGGQQIRYFRRRGIRQATMAGKIFKERLIENGGWIRQLPDLLTVRYFFPHFISKTKNRNDDTLLSTVVQLYSDYGIEFGPATDFAPELLVPAKLMTDSRLTSVEQRDVEYGWQIAKQMGGLDIGQTVIVKGRVVLAVEAIEGTDRCIARAGELCRGGGFTMVKVSKPQQDMRFDVPTIGVGTIEKLAAAGGSVLAIEAGKTIVLEEDKVAALANRLGVKVVAVDPQQLAGCGGLEHAAAA